MTKPIFALSTLHTFPGFPLEECLLRSWRVPHSLFLKTTTFFRNKPSTHSYVGPTVHDDSDEQFSVMVEPSLEES